MGVPRHHGSWLRSLASFLACDSFVSSVVTTKGRFFRFSMGSCCTESMEIPCFSHSAAVLIL